MSVARRAAHLAWRVAVEVPMACVVVGFWGALLTIGTCMGLAHILIAAHPDTDEDPPAT